MRSTATNQHCDFDPNCTAQHLVALSTLLKDSVADVDASPTGMSLGVPFPVSVLAVFDTAWRSRIEALLGELEFDVEPADSHAQVLEHVSRQRQYVTVTDSVELARALRTRGPTHLQHIVLLVDGDSCQEAEGYSAGATDCISLGSPQECLRARLAAVRRIQELEASLQAAVVRSRQHSALDDLTRVASRRFFVRHFPLEIGRAQQHSQALSLIACDIDHFKLVNDSYGHPGGDEVLREFSRRLRRNSLPQAGWIARLGGEEFGIVLPDTPYDAACVIALKMRRLIADTPFTVGCKEIIVTASFGICSIDRISARSTNLIDNMVKAADAALYKSKTDGRNRVTATILRSRDAGGECTSRTTENGAADAV
jgi:diguanylate cyclase (GGDEF)-like protein